MTAAVAAPDGLHIPLGPGERFDAYVDKVSPTNSPQAGGPTLDQQRVVEPEDRNHPTAPIMVDITLRGPKQE